MAELDGWLELRGVERQARDEVIERLQASGALDDSDFARRYAEDKRELSGWGTERIRETLRRRGLAPADFEPALADQDPELELERAVKALGSRQFDLSQDRDRNRALGFLARRGFTHEVAYRAIRIESPGYSD